MTVAELETKLKLKLIELEELIEQQEKLSAKIENCEWAIQVYQDSLGYYPRDQRLVAALPFLDASCLNSPPLFSENALTNIFFHVILITVKGANP